MKNGQVIPDGSCGSCCRKREAHECRSEETVHGDCGQAGFILFPESFLKKALLMKLFWLFHRMKSSRWKRVM